MPVDTSSPATSTRCWPIELPSSMTCAGPGKAIHTVLLFFDHGNADGLACSFVVKTACSSSLIALHNAVRAVQNRDCDAAIVSGSNLNMGPITTASMTQEGIMSPEGSCKTFDAHADGYGRGEAINAIYIKPLSHAIRDGNPIRAVIRNTGVNQDGQSTGLFATSIEAQEALMRKAYADAGLDPAETAMVEVSIPS